MIPTKESRTAPNVALELSPSQQKVIIFGDGKRIKRLEGEKENSTGCSCGENEKSEGGIW
jgi:hypothetical protein